MQTQTSVLAYSWATVHVHVHVQILFEESYARLTGEDIVNLS